MVKGEFENRLCEQAPPTQNSLESGPVLYKALPPPVFSLLLLIMPIRKLKAGANVSLTLFFNTC